MLSGFAQADYLSCQRPQGDWIGVDQGNGRASMSAITWRGSNLFMSGHAYGNMSISSVHRNGTSFGETSNHENVVIAHQTGSVATSSAGGRYSDAASSQHGMDSIIYKFSSAGVPQAIFAMDTLPIDGLLSGSQNGNWGGYSFMTGVANFEQASDTTSIVASGAFRGNLTVPIGSSGVTTVLSNGKSGRYDGFLVKINGDTMEGLWAVAPGQTSEGHARFREVATTAAGHVIATGDKRPSRDYVGRVHKVNGANGDLVWEKDYPGANSMEGLVAIGEDAFVGGRVEANGVDVFGTGTAITTPSDGDEYAAVVFKLNSAGNTTWVKLIGQGEVTALTTSPDLVHIYVAGENSIAVTDGSCSLTGTNGGFLMKILASTGACVWAKDIAAENWYVTADANHVYITSSDDDPLTMDATTTLSTRNGNSDTFLAKYAAADGSGEWATSFGGTGSEYVYGIAASAHGVALCGWGQSSSLSLAGVSITNLQHSRAAAADPSADTSGSLGQRTGWVGMLSLTGVVPSCLSGCSTTTDAATIASGNCYSNGQCYADGATDAFLACFSCDASASQTVMAGPDTTNHCYFGGICHVSGAMAPRYARYGQPSVCESCNPSIDPVAWSILPGFVHDRDLAPTRDSTNAYNMVFESGSNGCQMLPSLTVPSTQSAALGYATVAASIVAAEAIATKLSSADATALSAAATASQYSMIQRAINGSAEFTGVSEAARHALINILVTDSVPIHAAVGGVGPSSTTLAHWQDAWAYYNGNTATCTKVNGQCPTTPASTANAHAALFGTSFHYGHSVSTVKVLQGVALGAANAELTEPVAASAADFATDTELHMLVPSYQGVLAYTHGMDTGADAAAKKIAQLKAYAYWTTIEHGLSHVDAAMTSALSMALNPRATPTAPVANTTSVYCLAHELLMNNLPNSSMLEYTMGHQSGASVSASAGDGIYHFTTADIGDLSGASGVSCTPFTPPPAAVVGATHQVVFSLVANGVVADFTTDVQLGMRENIAIATGVTLPQVTLSISATAARRALQAAAATVMITVTILFTSASDAQAAATTVAAIVSGWDAAGLRAVLSTPELTITSPEGTTIAFDDSSLSIAPPAPPMAPPADAGTGLSTGALIGIIVGGVVVGILLLALIICSCKRKNEGKPIFLCLDEAKPAKPAGTATATASSGASATA
jgi:hypothetical protein